MSYCWNFLGNSRVQVVVPRGPRLLPLAPLTLYICVCVNVGLGSSLSKHLFDIQEIVAPVSNKDIVLLLLTVTGKFAAYFVLLNLTSIISFSFDRHSKSKEELTMLLELSESWCSLLLSGSERVLLDVCVEFVISLSLSLLLHGLFLCLSGGCYSDLYQCGRCYCH